jgi:hypothetical protein
MATNTPELGLFKKDPATDGATNFDLKTMINDNFDKIDTRAVTERQHRENTSNPHSTTAAQVGAYTKAEADTMAQGKADQAETDAINFAKSFGLGDVAKDISSTDLNNLDGTGFYRGANLTNGPLAASVSTNFFIINLKNATNYKTQLAFYYGAGASGAGRTWQRQNNGGTWSAWSELETTTGAQAKVDTHANRTDNPHATTAAQVGAYTKAEADGKYETPTGAQAKADAAETDAINWAKGLGLGGVAKDISNTDLNNLVSTGFYRGNNLTNGPIAANAANYFFIIDLQHSTTYTSQIALSFVTGSPIMYHRTNNNGTWSAWSQLETTTGAQAKADAVQTNLTNHIGTGGTSHAAAVANGANGFMLGTDKAKLDGVAANANNYSHPTGDGNLHVPATGTTNNLKVLKAGATAGSLSWGNMPFSELTSKPTTLSGYGITDAAPSSHTSDTNNPHATTAAQVGAYTKAEADGKYETPTGAQTKATAAETAAKTWAQGFGLGTTANSLTDNTDLNTLDGTGFYSGDLLTNAPSTAFYYIIHIKHNDTFKQQIAFTLSSTNAKMLQRRQDNGTWSAWTEMETTTGAQSKADTAETNAKNWAKSFGLGDMAKDISSTDLNVLDATGFYRGMSMTNAPNAHTGWLFYIHIKHDANYKVQMAFSYGPSPVMYQRVNANGTWSAWTQQATQDWVKSFGLGTIVKRLVGIDMDTLDIESGLYFADSSSINKPTTSSFSFIYEQYTTDVAHIIAFTHSDPTRTFTRRKTGGVWGAWIELLTTDNGVPYTGATKEVNLGTQLLRSRGTRYHDRNANGVEWELTEDLSNTGKFQLRKYVDGAYSSSPMNVAESGIFTFSTQPYVSAARTSTAALSAGVDTKVAFTTEYTDIQGEFASSQYVPKESGTYLLTGQVTLAAAPTGAFRIAIYENGVSLTSIEAGFAVRHMPYARQLIFDAGATYEFYVNSNSAVTLNTFTLQITKIT